MFGNSFQAHGCNWEDFWYFSQLSVLLITCKENQSPISNEFCKNSTSRKKGLYVKHNSKLLGKSH